MTSAELAEATGSDGREPQPHHPVIVVVEPAPNETGAFGTIDEPNGTVMSEHQRLGYFADGRAARSQTSADRQEELVLGRSQPCRNGLFLAPMQEVAQSGSELEQALVIAVGNLRLHLYIVTR